MSKNTLVVGKMTESQKEILTMLVALLAGLIFFFGIMWIAQAQEPTSCNPCQTYVEGEGCIWIRDSKTLYGKQFCIEPVKCGGVICPDWIPDTLEKVDLLADAIFWAEGGYETNYPYGIKSIKCEGYDECRRICKTTIERNIIRYHTARESEQGQIPRNYLEFFANRYCPTSGNLSASEEALNGNWLKNVKFYLENPKEAE